MYGIPYLRALTKTESPSSRASCQGSISQLAPIQVDSLIPMTGSGMINEARNGYAHVTAIIPCLDEEDAIGPCVTAVLDQGIGEVIVVDGGSQDRTRHNAAAAGARVIVEPRRGYGRALMTGIDNLDPAATVVLFLDGDGSDCPAMIGAVLAPIASGSADFVLGSRIRGIRMPSSMSAAQLVAGYLAGGMIRTLYGVRFTDMSPFRAIRRDTLQRLGMREETYGWNLEMQMRAAASGLRIVEVPVGQRQRAGGVSKVSGSLGTAARATVSLLQTFARLAVGLKRGR
jgi:glycosyltransferase involved in cell wall biosynthesis